MRQEFKGTIRWLGEVYLDQMDQLFQCSHFWKPSIPSPNIGAMNSPEPSAHGLPSVSWDVIFALIVGLCFIFGSVGVVVGQNVVVVVVARFFHFFGEYAFIFHHFGERARPSESIQDDQAKEHSGSIGTRIQRALMLTCDSFLNSFITLPKSPCLNPR